MALLTLAPNDMSPEDLAMLQALYSRSATPVRDHLAKVAEVGSAKFMSTYYLNYGHKSIGDCATDAVFIEGVSFLAAKAIQDSPLYNGQESSTRYIDFKTATFLDPLGTVQSREVQDGWRQLYAEVYTAVENELRCIGLAEDRTLEDDPSRLKVFLNAIHSRACDVARGFLPAGGTTQLSWSGKFSHFGDRLSELEQHPLPEVQDIARGVRKQLHAAYPSSFKAADYPERQAFYAKASHNMHYSNIDAEFRHLRGVKPQLCFYSTSYWYASPLKRYDPDLYLGRPPKTELPRAFVSLGPAVYEFYIDFGSFRDIQRHRNGLCRMPMLRGPYVPHPFYMESVPETFRQRIETLFAAQQERLANLVETYAKSDSLEALLQYYYPLSHLVPVRLQYDLPQSVYVAELRSTPFVHPTVRDIAQRIGRYVEANFPEIPLYVDYSPSKPYHMARGEQTFRKDT